MPTTIRHKSTDKRYRLYSKTQLYFDTVPIVPRLNLKTYTFLALIKAAPALSGFFAEVRVLP